MNSLDSYRLPLNSNALIEASAGTGKTYTIANLYIRILLGRGCDAHRVDNILLVTFTNAATAELKHRIRARIYEAYQVFVGSPTDDGFLSQLLEDSLDVNQDKQRLYLALRSIDDAAIFTIHGFCQRTLQQHAFASNSTFGLELILDDRPVFERAVADFWRSEVLTQREDVAEQIVDVWKEPKRFGEKVRTAIKRQAKVISSGMPTNPEEKLDAYYAAMDRAADHWFSANMAAQLLEAELHKSKPPGKPAAVEGFSCRLESKQYFSDDISKMLPYLSHEGILDASKATSCLPKETDFSLFEAASKARQDWFRSITNDFFQFAVSVIAKRVINEKIQQQLLSTDDLLTLLDDAVSENPLLAQTLRQQYPIAMIDEFQDTDPTQYTLFSTIYHKAGGLLMIGDPKQAIYAFRGADIFTYLKAKEDVAAKDQYTLATNYRSSQRLIDAIEDLFSAHPKSFLQDDIRFVPVNAGKELTLASGVSDAAIDVLACTSTERLTEKKIKDEVADTTAARISQWLDAGNRGTALLDGRPVTAGDCCVLVNDRNEADSIKQALFKLGINSVFVGRFSVFSSQVAKDCYALMRAIFEPGNEYALRNAIGSELLAYTASELDNLIRDEANWQRTSDIFWYARSIWDKQGIMPALAHIEQALGIQAQIIKRHQDPYRSLTNFRHIGELLQQKSQQLHGQYQLLRYLHQSIAKPDVDNEAEQLRLESDTSLVQIVTIHRSKGLQYPLVFLPYAYKAKAKIDEVLFHQNGELIMDVSDDVDPRHKECAVNEVLAEQLRLLYVALTRAEYHVCISMAACGSKNILTTAKSAIGYLLGLSERDKDNALWQALADWQQRSKGKAKLIDSPIKAIRLATQQASKTDLQAAVLTRPVRLPWRMTSYSALAKHGSHQDVAYLQPGRDEGREPADMVNDSTSALMRFTFQKGAAAGSFLHDVLEHGDLNQPELFEAVIDEYATRHGIALEDRDQLRQWLSEVSGAPLLGEKSYCLADIPSHQQVAEMEFYLPLSEVNASAFNQVLRQDPHFAQCAYQFEKLTGMLKGYIDLTYQMDGRYFVADYKSNHLGYRFDDYQQQHCIEAMHEHDYFLQAVIYSVALHRHLRLSIADYDYDRHHGGALYLFLRGMHQDHPAAGIVHYRPALRLIETLDSLFAGEKQGV